MNVRNFCTARKILECCEDFGELVALVTVALSRKTPPTHTLLSSVADTINLHAETFAVLGSLPDLLENVSQQYLNIRSQAPHQLPAQSTLQGPQQALLVRTMMLALLSLVRRLTSLDLEHINKGGKLTRSSFVKLLESDLAVYDAQQSFLSACSPASDNLVNMHAAELSSDADIDAVFASGNTMDESLMARVLDKIMTRCVCGKPSAAIGISGSVVESHSDCESSKVCSWLGQLRAVDISGFETIVTKYISTAMSNADPRPMSELLTRLDLTTDTKTVSNPLDPIITLISSGSASFESLADTALGYSPSSAPAAATLVLQLLSIDSRSLVDRTVLDDTELYSFRVAQTNYRRGRLGKISQLVSKAFEFPGVWPSLCDEAGSKAHGFLDLVLDCSARFDTFLNDVLGLGDGGDTKSTSPTLIANQRRFAAVLSQIAAGEVAKLDNMIGLDAVNTPFTDAGKLISCTEPLSIRFCVAYMKYVATPQGEPAERVNSTGDSSSVIAIIHAISRNSETWPQLLASLALHEARQVYAWVRDRVLDCAMPNATSATARTADENTRPQASMMPNIDTLDRQLEALDIAYHHVAATISNEERLQMNAAITERLRALYALLCDADNAGSHDDDAMRDDQSTDEVRQPRLFPIDRLLLCRNSLLIWSQLQELATIQPGLPVRARAVVSAPPDSPTTTHDLVTAQTALLSALCAISIRLDFAQPLRGQYRAASHGTLDHRKTVLPEGILSLRVYLHDMISSLADAVPQSTLAAITSSLAGSKVSGMSVAAPPAGDARAVQAALANVLGYTVPDSDSWLALASHAQPAIASAIAAAASQSQGTPSSGQVPNAGTPAAPTQASQQQRVLMKRQQQQQAQRQQMQAGNLALNTSQAMLHQSRMSSTLPASMARVLSSSTSFSPGAHSPTSSLNLNDNTSSPLDDHSTPTARFFTNSPVSHHGPFAPPAPSTLGSGTTHPASNPPNTPGAGPNAGLTSGPSASAPDRHAAATPSSISHGPPPQQQKPPLLVVPYPLRPWEILSDAAPGSRRKRHEFEFDAVWCAPTFVTFRCFLCLIALPPPGCMRRWSAPIFFSPFASMHA
ncbi:hypothetical protein MRB53_041977 [Persea americana]|nr:hypothetical protein MRB53_041977 [Persea americana]